MGRSLRVAILGWATGFLVALAAGGLANRTGNPRLAAGMLTAAAVGAAVMALLVIATTVGDMFARRLGGAEEAGPAESEPRTEQAEAPSPAQPEAERDAPAVPSPARPAAAPAVPSPARHAPAPAADVAAARIALLEAKLALEEEQLRAAVEALATTDALAEANAETARREAERAPAAAAEEPALREELLDAIARLAAHDSRVSADGHRLREAG